MPFKSEKQRRYLWANEPEIARDWTNTYGSRIQKDNGGITNPRLLPHQPRDLLVQNSPYGTRPRYQPPGHRDAPVGGPPGGGATSQGSGRDAPGSDRGPRDAPDRFGPVQTVTQSTGGDRIIDVAQRKQRQDIRDLIAQQQAEKDYTRTGQIKPGPQLGLARSGVGGGLGNWASQFAGSKIGGGLGSMLFGPWGMLLGAMFGRGVGKRGWQARQTDEKETARDILMPEFMQNLGLFNKRTRDMSDFNKLGLGGTQPGTLDFDPNARISDTSFSPKQGTEGMKPKGFPPMSFARYGIEDRINQLGDDSISPSAISLADMSREDFDKLADKSGIGGLDLIQSRYKGQEYLDDLSEIGKDTDYIGPTQEELAAGINLGDLTGDVWTGGKGLERMNKSEYENYLRGYR